MQPDTELLKEIGLTEGEIKVYLALIKLGSSSTGNIIKQSMIHASKVYPILDRLIDKGLVSYIKEGKKRIYCANSPETIISYLNEKEQQLKHQKESAKSLIHKLEQLKKLAEVETKTEATVFRGLRGLKTAYLTSKNDVKKGETIYGMFLPAVNPQLLGFFKEYIEDFSKKLVVKNLLLFNENCDEINLVKDIPGVDVKVLSQQFKSPAEISIHHNNVLISTTAGKELLSFLIKNKEIADAFKAQFNFLWKQDVKTYIGFEGVKEVFNDTLNYKHIWFIGGNWGIKKYFYNYWKEYELKRLKKKIYWHDLILRAYRQEEFYNEYQTKDKKDLWKKYYYEFKELPKELTSPHVICIYGNKVANILWGKETRIYLVENKDIFNSYKKYYNLLWKIADQKTRIYYGKEGAVKVLEEAIEAGRRGEELLGFGTDKDDYLEYCPMEMNQHFQQQKKYNIKWKLLFGEGFKSPNPMAEIRFLSRGMELPVRTMIYGDKVAIVDFTVPVTTIIIDKKEVAQAYKRHFEFLWKIGRK